MKPQIIEKLNRFLEIHTPFKEEWEAVYLMVELRKLLDREQEDRENTNGQYFPLIRFYCDWTVHTSKDRNTQAISEVMNKINEEPNDIDFLSMSELREEIRKLFTEVGLPTQLCLDQVMWKHFVNVFVQVLADQPITNVSGGISSFCYVRSKTGQLTVVITFNDQRTPLFKEIQDIF